MAMYLEKKDLAKIFKIAYEENRTHHLALISLYYTGTRISQLLSLHGADVFKAGDIWKVRIKAAKGGKTVVRDLHIESDPVFDMTPLIALAEQKGTNRLFGALTRQYLDLMLKRYGQMAGIHEDYLHAHVLRHSCAMEIWTATNRLGAITEFLGHSSPMSALAYLAENDGRLGQETMNNVRLS